MKKVKKYTLMTNVPMMQKKKKKRYFGVRSNITKLKKKMSS